MAELGGWKIFFMSFLKKRGQFKKILRFFFLLNHAALFTLEKYLNGHNDGGPDLKFKKTAPGGGVETFSLQFSMI